MDLAIFYKGVKKIGNPTNLDYPTQTVRVGLVWTENLEKLKVGLGSRVVQFRERVDPTRPMYVYV